MRNHEAVVIGAGPGGYEAALQLAKAGIKTLIIEQVETRIGGTCLNEGCIPTKNYLRSAEYFSKASFFKENGLDIDVSGLDLARLKNRTDLLKNELRSGMLWMMKQAGIAFLYGTAHFVDDKTIEVAGEKITFDKCIIATGSQVKALPLLPIDGKNIISSREIFELEKLPESIAIIGGGTIGCEFATFFNAFGVDVTLVEYLAQLVPSEDADIAADLMRRFKKQRINVLTASFVQKVHQKEDGVELHISGQMQDIIRCETVLCATGRIPYTQGLGIENCSVKVNEKGFIEVNESFQTANKNIYAVGDCIETIAYAHTAYAEAKIAAQNIRNHSSEVNSHVTPSVVFSHPAIGSCGVKEKEAKEKGFDIEVKKAFFKANPKAKIEGDDSGFAKIIVCANSGEILGCSIIGAGAVEIIHEMVLAVEKKIKMEEFKGMIHAHPTLSEILSSI
ncbi:dihydrolipoyl dehydrogenase [Desulfobacter sp.]